MKTLQLTRFRAIALLLCAPIPSALAVTFTHDTFISFADLSHEGQDIVVTNCTLTVDGPHAFNSLQVLNGAVLTHSPFTYGPEQFTESVFDEPHTLSTNAPAILDNTNIDASTIVVGSTSGAIVYLENVDYTVTISNRYTLLTLTPQSSITGPVVVDYDWSQEFQGFDLSVASDVTVAAGGAINVSGMGYNGAIGFPNAAGTSRGTNYPFSFTAGGGAGHGGSGGMSSTFAAGGATYDSTTAPGDLGSGGGNGTSAGGSGGGMAILNVGGNVQIDGLIAANGFNGTNTHSGGGSGGSVLITAQGGFSGAGAITANGGAGDLPDGGGGGGGRIALYFGTNSFTGAISAMGGGGVSAGGAGTVYLKSKSDVPGQLFIVNGGKRGTNTTFSVTNLDQLLISGGAVAQSLPSLLVNNLYVLSNSWLTATDAVPLVIAVVRNASVESTAMINADARSSFVSGAGSAICGAGSGGSYGGYGGASACGSPGGHILYGNVTRPFSLGSPGGSGIGLGGGAVSLNVGGTLSLDGSISANGGSAITRSSGGGSGGSVWLTVGLLSGSGTISANGGSASNLVSGGGSGGRIAVYSGSNSFTGAITAYGGTGANTGGPGTIFLQNSNSVSQLIFDNGGLPGATGLAGDTDVPYIPGRGDLTITGGAVLTNLVANAPISVRNLFIGPNSWLTTLRQPARQAFFISALNATIQAGGGIIEDGNSTSTGNSGQYLAGTGGGGGSAGFGGASATNAAGGIAPGTLTVTGTAGGNGGGGINGPGGMGGGIINLTVSNKLQLDGYLSANGLPGAGLNSGGGAAGSVVISAPLLSGAGTITASGGSGNNAGGGGGGGFVMLFLDTNSFQGTIAAQGGAGANYGGAGVVYSGLSHVPIFNQTAEQIVIDNGGNRGARTPWSFAGLTMNAFITGGAVVTNGGYGSTPQFGNLTIGSNSTVQVSTLSQQSLSVLTNLVVLAGGSITADGLNSSGSGFGQTLNSTGGGGGAAGYGGNSASNALGGIPTIDSPLQPFSPGGRGGNGFNQGPGGNGGGSLRIIVGRRLQLDGRISADGAPGGVLNSGGGGGGTLNISIAAGAVTGTFTGRGTLSANGGAGNAMGGGGGGGHIMVTYTTNAFTGALTAHGGVGANNGGAGIIFLSQSPSLLFPPQQILIDNGGLIGAVTPWGSGNLSDITAISITGGAVLSNSTFSIQSVGALLLGSNSTWIIGASPLSRQTSLGVLSNAVIQAGATLTMSGSVPAGPGQGQSLNGTGGGGGYAGYGGASISNAPGGNASPDSATSPAGTGSQGGFNGGLGGGALRFTVRGALQLDGRISSDGLAGSVPNSGGGSGGSVWVTAAKFSGAGAISANGGAGNNGGGGGGGGRVAVWFNTNLFTGSFMARGGTGAHYGGAGTIFLTSSTTGVGKSSQLIVDNGGAHGTNTLINGTGSTTDFIISNGASVAVSGANVSFWNNLTISSGSSLSLASTSTSATIMVTNNLTLEAGGSIALDGQGNQADSGPGPGGSIGGGGGGHGGFGGPGNYPHGQGGASYDSISEPTQPGSGGGASQFLGSAGGGALHLMVSGALTNNGTISANGQPGTLSGAGGGAGGSLWLSAGKFAGSGKISADGGNGEIFGGGGGGAGGRIAIYFNSNQFAGTISAHGGSGPSLAGGAGTIYLKTNNLAVPQVILDNNGTPGTNTPLDALSSSAAPTVPAVLSIANGAAGSAVQLTLQSLSVNAGGTLNPVFGVPLNVSVTRNALVDAGGSINANTFGDASGAQTGTGSVDYFGNGSGGGYGGAGGASLFGAPGGITFGSSNQPISFGSRGGISPDIFGFSQGGGAVRLTVNGTLTVNGSISANGNDGFIAGSGGGSGGSVWITSQSLSGNGSITANGGTGESDEGGGGGGGRIAIYTGTNSFTGNVLATGGDGAMPGQDGTIYVPTSFSISGVVSNSNGTATPGITLQSTGLAPVSSDANGAYTVTVSPIWKGTIAPMANGVIIPSSRTYTNLLADATGQDFLVTTPAAFNLAGGQCDGTNMMFNWYGINGVKYQPLCSTNLVDWAPYGPPFIGSNAPVMIACPATNAPQMFFRLQVTY